MAISSRERAIQYTFGHDLFPTEVVDVLSPEKNRDPYHIGSQSRWERAGRALDRPGELIIDPRAIPTEQHVNILAGLAMHDISLATNIWRSAITQAGDFKKAYFSNLNRLSNHIPSHKASSVRLIFELLKDEELAIQRTNEPLRWDQRFDKYELVTWKMLDWMKGVIPFTDTPPFKEFRDNPRLVGEIPFPDPNKVNQAWYEKGMDELVLSRVENLFCHDEDRAIVPTDHARYSSQVFFNELRLATVIHPLELVFTTRLDEVIISRESGSGLRKIKVTDYKLSEPYFPERFTKERSAMFFATWLAANCLLALPQDIEASGKAVNVDIDLYSDDPGTEIEFVHRGFGNYPLPELNLSQDEEQNINWSRFWKNRGNFFQAWDGLKEFLGELRSPQNEERLAPILG
jgi:hypothetical protein